MTMIEKIKQSIKLEPMVAQACGGLKPSGYSKRYLIGYCPFCQNPPKHKARPRFWVDTELHLCNCFKPSCQSQKPMDVINFYARLNNLDNQTAIADLHLERILK